MQKLMLAANPVNGKRSQNTITSQLMLTSIAGRTNVDAETVPNNDVNYKTFVCTDDGPQEEANRQPQQQGRPFDSIPSTKNGNRATMHDACVDHGLQHRIQGSLQIKPVHTQQPGWNWCCDGNVHVICDARPTLRLLGSNKQLFIIFLFSVFSEQI